MKFPSCFHRVSIKGLISDEQNRFLLMQEANGFWDLPGGGMDHGESPAVCLRREIKEEMGLEIVSMDKAPSFFFASTNPKGQPIVNAVYKISLTNLNFAASEECMAIRFFSVPDIKKLHQQMYPNILDFIRYFEV